MNKTSDHSLIESESGGLKEARSLATFRLRIFRFSARLDASTDSIRAMKMDDLSLAGRNRSILDGC